jgi:DNA-binding NtrC family response regulator
VRDYHSAHVAGDYPHDLQPLEELERRYILRVMDACKGNQSQAARVLGIGGKTLYRRLVSFGVALSETEGQGADSDG